MNQILEKIKRGITEVISEPELLNKLKKNKPLKIKAGFDPTAPDLHLGHTVLLNKLRQFQDLGHIVYFLIGDFTARIGDPTGQVKARPIMSEKEIQDNTKTYKKQVFKILDPKKTKIVFNNSWYKKMRLSEVYNIISKHTVQRLIERDDFTIRKNSGKPIFMSEFIYPILQGYDSVELKADVEIGGTDQKFNMLMARDVQSSYQQEPQVVITLPLLEGLDGVNKMSKSLGNYVGINENPNEMFGKLMSVSDSLMMRYFELLTDFDLEEIKKMHPMEAKKKLALTITTRYSSLEKALSAQKQFENVFQKKESPLDINTLELEINCPKILFLDLPNLKGINLSESKNELRRLVQQKAIEINEQKINDVNYVLEAGKEYLIKIGKKKFIKIRLKYRSSLA